MLRAVGQAQVALQFRHEADLHLAVVEQIDRHALMHSQQGAVRLPAETRARLREPHELRQLRKTNILPHRTRGIKQGILAQAAVLETAAQAFHFLALAIRVTAGNTPRVPIRQGGRAESIRLWATRQGQRLRKFY